MLLAVCVSVVQAKENGNAGASLIDGNPNIVFILCDDLGYGDVHCLTPDTCKIETPAIDRLVSAGMVFTDAHSGSSVCTPTRYGLMTGRFTAGVRAYRRGSCRGLSLR